MTKALLFFCNKYKNDVRQTKVANYRMRLLFLFSAT